MIELLLKLEMSLWINETRNNPEYLKSILHKDFKEFGKSGKVFTKIDILRDINQNINAVFPFKNLEVKQLDEETYLTTYQSELIEDGTSVLSNRSSIWIGKEHPQLIFHQGTISK